MANPRLNPDQLKKADALLNDIRSKLGELSRGDKTLLFAYRRKIYKELTYDERGKPMHRKRLKEIKRAEQDGLCPVCGEQLPEKYVVLDRFRAVDGYTPENTRLIHPYCDADIQKSRRYS